MTKSFSDNERSDITEKLLIKGREYFEKYGLKRTSIGDLTKAAGISQGSFYSFFNSKEELYFEILEDEEKKLAVYFTDSIPSKNLTKDSFRKILNDYFQVVHGNQIIANLITQNEYALLMRKLPEDKRKQHLENESWIVNSIIRPIIDSGIVRDVNPDALSALFHGIFLLQMHKNDIGEIIFPEVMELITDLLVDGLLINEK